MPDPNNAAKEAFDQADEGEDRRQGAKDRRNADKDRRNPERVADEIAPRRHPEVKGRRTTDE